VHVIFQGVDKNLSVFIPHASSRRECPPTKRWAVIKSLSTAGVSLNTVSVANDLLHRFTLHAGKRERQCCFKLSEIRTRANFVVTEKVHLIVLDGAQPNKGRIKLISVCQLVTDAIFTPYVPQTKNQPPCSHRQGSQRSLVHSCIAVGNGLMSILPIVIKGSMMNDIISGILKDYKIVDVIFKYAWIPINISSHDNMRKKFPINEA
jgi:hypothetical protein